MIRPLRGEVRVLRRRLALVNRGAKFAAMTHPTITRGDIIWLGVASGTTGGLIGGLFLGIGIAMMLSGAPIGLLLICIGAPASALIGWLLSRRLARQAELSD